jgi:predicted transcriptional regulator
MTACRLMPLHPLEREIMRQLWRLGPVTVREVLEGLNDGAQRPRAYTTILTVLGRLEHKGFVARERVGRADRYAATVAEDSWLRGRASDEVDRLLEDYGDIALAHFAQEVDRLDDARRRRLRALLDDG